MISSERPTRPQATHGLVFEPGDGIVFRDAIEGHRLMLLPSPHLMQPVIDGVAIDATLVETRDEGELVTFCFEASGVEGFEVRLALGDDGIDLSCRFAPTADGRLDQLNLLPVGTRLNLNDLVNFRNRHRTPATWPELNLGDSIETDTYSRDWQFAPHPSLLIFRKAQTHLLAALADLPVGTFGLHLAVDHQCIEHAYLDYGQEHGLQLRAGEMFESPRLRLILRHGESVYDTIDAFTGTLIREGQIPAPESRVIEDWWTDPLYCTWIDQGFVSNSTEPAPKMLSEAMVRQAVEVIEREELPIRTILLDEGWHVTRGQWEPHPERFPDMRGLVDELHAKGFKVVIWLAWPEVYPDAEVPPEILCGGPDWRTRHGQRFVDYSSPVTQEQYLRPLMHKLFSSEPGCYDFDGLKTDFQADKVHPETPLANPQWRGEENYLTRVTKIFHHELKRHKADAMHLGCAGHFWAAPYIDVNRTYDVETSDWREHERRALMLRHTAPGSGIAYDLHNYVENLDRWFASAEALGASIQIGNLLYVKDDLFSDARPADDDYYRRLREAMSDRLAPPTHDETQGEKEDTTENRDPNPPAPGIASIPTHAG